MKEIVSGSTTSTAQYVCLMGVRVEERDASGALTNQLFVTGERNSSSNYFYSKDSLGNILQVSDNSGNSVANYGYNLTGQIVRQSGTYNSARRFCGYLYHERSKLSLTKNRAYNPDLARFISRDKLLEAGGANLYAYVGNSFANAADPSGLANPAETFGHYVQGSGNTLITQFSNVDLGSFELKDLKCVKEAYSEAQSRWKSMKKKCSFDVEAKCDQSIEAGGWDWGALGWFTVRFDGTVHVSRTGHATAKGVLSAPFGDYYDSNESAHRSPQGQAFTNILRGLRPVGARDFKIIIQGSRYMEYDLNEL